MAHQGADPMRLEQTLAQIQKKLVVLSGKGGVGKSTVAANIALSLAQRGMQTGLLDSDLHGPSIPKMLGMEKLVAAGTQERIVPPVHNKGYLKVMSVQFLLPNLTDSVIWRGPLKHAILSQFVGHTEWGPLDYLVVDSPPGTGDEPLSVIQTLKPDYAVIVTTPQDIATFDVRKSLDFCRRLELPVAGVIENMSGFSCPHCGECTPIFGSGGGKQMAEEAGVRFLGQLPIDPRCVALADSGRTIVENDSDLPIGGELNSIVEKLMSLE